MITVTTVPVTTVTVTVTVTTVTVTTVTVKVTDSAVRVCVAAADDWGRGLHATVGSSARGKHGKLGRVDWP